MRASLSNGSVTPVVAGDQWLSSWSGVAGQGVTYVVTTPETPGDVHLRPWRAGSELRLPDVNREWLSEVALPEEGDAVRLGFAKATGE